jgi:hypothetical protein
MSEMMKRCSYPTHQGPRYLPLIEFPVKKRYDIKNPTSDTYYDSWCMWCKRRYQRQWLKKQQERPLVGAVEK